jgi:hypothetical protein
MKAIRIAFLIALIALPSSSFARSRGGAVVVRTGFSGRTVATGFVGGAATGIPGRAVVVRPGFPAGVGFVRPGFGNRVVFIKPGFPARFVAGGVATGIVLNPFFFPRSFYFSGPFIYYYPPSRVFASSYYPPSYSYEVAPPAEIAPPAPSTPAPSDAYDRGYSEGYAQGYEQAQKEREKERYEEGKKRGYEEGYEAGKEVESP